MATYIGKDPLPEGYQFRYSFEAGAEQTIINFNYNAGYIDVFANGIKLKNGVDFTAIDNVSIVFTEGLVEGTEIDVVGVKAFEIANVYTKLDVEKQISDALSTFRLQLIQDFNL